MQRNPTFVRRYTKTELANHISRQDRKIDVLRNSISDYLLWYDCPNGQEMAAEALERLRLVLKVTAK